MTDRERIIRARELIEEAIDELTVLDYVRPSVLEPAQSAWYAVDFIARTVFGDPVPID